MKTLKFITFGIFLFISSTIHSQVSINVNIGSPPQWGPVGYTEMEYYYLPDIEAYYDVRATQFIYFGGGKWVRSNRLPRQYQNYDLYGGYKVVLNDYHGRAPYAYFDRHKVKYGKGYRGKPQKTYGNYKKDHHKKSDRDDRHDRNDNHDRGRGNGHGRH
ncbi:hypothetical protein IUY40_07400 [Flavobacterium sp. ALJ2]|uniref:hypothetical protein n=1 Tax=Flavobacterium sp. ALJ2 TaxID=2786960 RepID=UPI0018A1192B|nr:hypothetical protein [Flavobacterium sp. ALJ2]MBF7091360.1 hypothetical protein [Flavobacterium sp. ALJ2]